MMNFDINCDDGSSSNDNNFTKTTIDLDNYGNHVGERSKSNTLSIDNHHHQLDHYHNRNHTHYNYNELFPAKDLDSHLNKINDDSFQEIKTKLAFRLNETSTGLTNYSHSRNNSINFNLEDSNSKINTHDSSGNKLLHYSNNNKNNDYNSNNNENDYCFNGNSLFGGHDFEKFRQVDCNHMQQDSLLKNNNLQFIQLRNFPSTCPTPVATPTSRTPTPVSPDSLDFIFHESKNATPNESSQFFCKRFFSEDDNLADEFNKRFCPMSQEQQVSVSLRVFVSLPFFFS
eukprot:Awhi_evm1s5707